MVLFLYSLAALQQHWRWRSGPARAGSRESCRQGRKSYPWLCPSLDRRLDRQQANKAVRWFGECLISASGLAIRHHAGPLMDVSWPSWSLPDPIFFFALTFDLPASLAITLPGEHHFLRRSRWLPKTKIFQCMPATSTSPPTFSSGTTRKEKNHKKKLTG